MQRKLRNIKFIFTIIAALFGFNSVNAQCTWQTKLTEGFEYQTACPDVIAGTVYTNIPQSYSVHGGAYSLYLNFVDCASGSGTCAGDTVYKRTIAVCPNVALKISSWFTTTFSGGQCNLHIVVLDANNVVLHNTANVLVPYSPTWTQFQSGTFTPSTPSIKFILITNIDGGNGNDLSMDDFLMEQCPDFSIGKDTTLCNNLTLTLNAGTGYSTCLWNNNATSQTVVVSSSGSGTDTSFYSVTVTDAGGCTFNDTIRIIFANCAGVNDLTNENQFSIYPNPANGYVNIFSEKNFNNAYFVLSDLAGREVLRVKIRNKMQAVSLSNISNGIYFCRITDGKNLNDFWKLIVDSHSF